MKTVEVDPRRRLEMVDELYRRWGGQHSGRMGRLRYLYKKYAWLLVVGGARALKRGIDVAASLLGLIALAPLFAGVALAIKLTDRGPIFFWQSRVGQWGREFPFPKFRSMVINAEQLKDQLLKASDHGDSVTFKMKKDPRVTWIGRLIRRTSVDELPQLWCILRGDMSLVGPRPPVPREVALYTLRDRRRLDVIPGLTCIWQVEGRGNIPFKQQVEMDVAYIESHSFWFDFVLLLKTVPAVVTGKGAY